MLPQDEVYSEGTTPGLVVQAWQGDGTTGKLALADKFPVVFSPTTKVYFDYTYARLPLADTASFAPPSDAFGVEACVWTEHLPWPLIDLRLWPRLAIFARSAWSGHTGVDRCPEDEWRTSLEVHKHRLSAIGVNCSIEDLDQQYTKAIKKLWDQYRADGGDGPVTHVRNTREEHTEL